MNKITLLKVTNLLLFISMSVQILTSIVLFFDLFTANARLFETIAQIHKYNGLILVLLVAVHVMLNWGWIKSQFFKTRTS